MMIRLEDRIRERAVQLAGLSGIGYHIFDHEVRDFSPPLLPVFCDACILNKNGECAPLNTHKYGVYEAERWNGLYIYYCPIGLAFIATLIYNDKLPQYSLIGGPAVMGSAADVLTDNGGQMIEAILCLPANSAERITHLSQIQWSLSMFLSGKEADAMDYSEQAKSNLLNTLYDVTIELNDSKKYSYPLAIEQRLQNMIIQGDKEGSQELINQLLGHIYFQSSGHFAAIKEQASALVVLFSRASIEGGADPKQIFGLNRDIREEINTFQTLDELSVFLTSVFHRFVGYIFDFNQVKHVDTIHKVMSHVREHYTQKITLDDVADHVFLSKSYLSKIFKEEMNCSFTQYVNIQRIDKSKELLLDSSISIAELATLVGFNDQSYFSKVFSRIVGVTPQQFRVSRGKITKQHRESLGGIKGESR